MNARSSSRRSTSEEAAGGEVAAAVVAIWARADKELAAIRRQEVAALTDETALEATMDLLAALDLLPRLPPRQSSGLVEQQRILARARPS